MTGNWIDESRRRVNEAMRRVAYRCPKHKEFRAELSEESKEALRQAAAELEDEPRGGVE